MHFILNPLILNIISILVPLGLLHFIIQLLKSFLYKTYDIYEYKIHNKYLSLIFIVGYIGIIIIGFYIIRLHNLPRELDLKILSRKLFTITHNLFTLTGNSIYLFFNIILIGILGCFLIMKLHKEVYKEIYKWFLFYVADQNSHRKKHEKYFNVIEKHLCSIALSRDLLHYFLVRLSYYHTIKQYGKQKTIYINYSNLPWYNSTYIIKLLIDNGYYANFSIAFHSI